MAVLVSMLSEKIDTLVIVNYNSLVLTVKLTTVLNHAVLLHVGMVELVAKMTISFIVVVPLASLDNIVKLMKMNV